MGSASADGGPPRRPSPVGRTPFRILGDFRRHRPMRARSPSSPTSSTSLGIPADPARLRRHRTAYGLQYPFDPYNTEGPSAVPSRNGNLGQTTKGDSASSIHPQFLAS